MSAASPHRLVVPFDRFPPLHQTLWKSGMTERDRYGSRPYGATLSPYTERGARHGWGRFLASCPETTRSARPGELVSPPTVRRFIKELKSARNRGNTIANRLCEVRTALRIMCPNADFSWLTSPGGNNVRSLFQSERRPITIYHPRLLYSWGLELMDHGLRISEPKRRAVQYRDGLLIAILAARAPRLRSIAAIQLGNQIVPRDGRYRLVFGKRDLKWKKALLEYDLPAGLTDRIEHYLDVERPVLLNGASNDWLWIGLLGARLRERGIEGMVRRQSRRRFGESFGPHRFRHAAGTIAPMADPRRPAAVAAVLGNSKAVAETAYNLGRRQEALAKYQDSLRQERHRLEGIALRVFRRTDQRRRRIAPHGS